MDTIKSYQCDEDGLYTGRINELPFVPFGSITTELPSDRLPEGRAWKWDSPLPMADVNWGKEGKWVGVKNWEGTQLFAADGSPYTIGHIWNSISFKGYGDLPEWLSVVPRPSAYHTLVNNTWQTTADAMRAWLEESQALAVRRIDDAYLNAMTIYSIKAPERAAKVAEAGRLDSINTPMLNSYAQAAGLTREAAAAKILGNRDSAEQALVRLSLLKNLKYGVAALTSATEVIAYADSAVKRIEELAQTLN